MKPSDRDVTKYNALESEHGIISSMFIRICEAKPNSDEQLSISQAIDVSYQLYGSDIMSAYEVSHAFTKTLYDQYIFNCNDIFSAQIELEVKRKLTRILRSKFSNLPSLAEWDLVEVYISDGKNKRGKWSSPRIVTNCDHKNGTVTVPGTTGRVVQAALKDIRHGIIDESFARVVRDTNDQLDLSIEELLEESSAPYELANLTTSQKASLCFDAE